MHINVPADVIVEPGHLPGHDPGERDVVVQGQPFVVVGRQLIDDCLLKAGRVLAGGRNAAVSGRGTMKDLRPSISRARLVVFGITANAIVRGVAKRDDDAAGNISQRCGFGGEFSTSHDIPTGCKVSVSRRLCGGRGLYLIGLELVGTDLRVADDAAANRECCGIDECRGVLEVAHELGRRRTAVSERHGFTKCRGVGRAAPFYLA